MNNRSDTFISKSQTPPPPIEVIISTKPTDVVPTYSENRSDLLTSPSEGLPSSREQADIPLTPGVSIPHKTSIEGKHPIKSIYSFLNEARRWALQTRDITYSTLMLSTEEILQQIPTRKPAGILRKIPDIDSQILTKAAKDRSSKEVY